MRVTLIGATGLAGKALMRTWDHGRLTGLGSKDVDIRHEGQVAAAIERTRPDWIILAAAYTDVDGCESNSQLAFDVNARGPANVARAASQAGARLLHLSTDYVFDGAKTTPYETEDPIAPLSVYGRSKAEGEAAVASILPQSCIVRTSWVFGMGRTNFPEAILQLASTRN